MKSKIFKYKFLIGGIIILLISAFIAYHNVPKSVSTEDKHYIGLMIRSDLMNKKLNTYEDEINFISQIQLQLHDSFKLTQPIQYSHTREPKDLFENKQGQCYDFSRTIEKILIIKQLETRHVAIYQRLNSSTFKILTTPKSSSHSLLEVKTKKGWMIVDSNYPFLAIDNKNNPISFKQLVKASSVEWKNEIPKGYEIYYKEPVIPIYGLYSRHGKFYKPYDFVPDYNFCELLYNFSSI